MVKKLMNEFKELDVGPFLAKLVNVGLTLIDAGYADVRWFDVRKLPQVRLERRAPASAAPQTFSSARSPLVPPASRDDDDEVIKFDGIAGAGAEERAASSPARAGAAAAHARLFPGTRGAWDISAFVVTCRLGGGLLVRTISAYGVALGRCGCDLGLRHR
jgi:hypothetical protein